ncbi:MAG: DUF4956 domain-containing protein [Lachnospiraceae bacterium]|nr:DUF4956 domain-containing protein [Lachnospiraceae bacterium]
MDALFNGLLTGTEAELTLGVFAICFAASLMLGAVIAAVYRYTSDSTRGFVATVAIIPAIVCVIIMMVSGSLGAGVAVAGTFSLVRFRSAQGTAREIGAIFLAMAAGLACGMGYPAFAALFTIVMCAVVFIYSLINFGDDMRSPIRYMSVTIPETLEYGGLFDDIFDKYAKDAKMISVKTTTLGSLNKVAYSLKLKSPDTEKAFIDEIRERNGNLEISLSTLQPEAVEL